MDKPNAFWRKVLWSDKTKIELLWYTDESYILKSRGDPFKPKTSVPTVKHGGSGTGTLHKVDGQMKKEDYLQFPEFHLKLGAKKLKLGQSRFF